MRHVLVLALALSACTSANSDVKPTRDSLEQLCVETSECLVDSCSDSLQAVADAKSAEPPSYGACLDSCSTPECLDACDALPEVVLWNEQVAASHDALVICESDCTSPFYPPDLKAVPVWQKCFFESDPSEKCAIERGLFFFDTEDDYIDQCSKWSSLLDVGG